MPIFFLRDAVIVLASLTITMAQLADVRPAEHATLASSGLAVLRHDRDGTWFASTGTAQVPAPEAARAAAGALEADPALAADLDAWKRAHPEPIPVIEPTPDEILLRALAEKVAPTAAELAAARAALAAERGKGPR